MPVHYCILSVLRVLSVSLDCSQDWNTPGKMWCDGPRQETVFRACLPTAAAATAAEEMSRPSARMPVVAGAAVGSSGASSGSGGGAVHIVPLGSSHGSFTDLPFLLPHWATTTLRKLVGVIGIYWSATVVNAKQGPS